MSRINTVEESFMSTKAVDFDLVIPSCIEDASQIYRDQLTEREQGFYLRMDQ